jgi:hypothetical protein
VALVPGLAQAPLEVHASYSREEILAALGFAWLRRTPSTMLEGVAWCESFNADAFLITLKIDLGGGSCGGNDRTRVPR